MGKISTINFKIDEDLKKEFKKVCIENDTTQSDVLKEFIKLYIKNKKMEK